MAGLQEIEAKAKERYEKRKAWMRENYKLARELGFSSQEAQVLQGRSKARIKELAEEKANRETETPSVSGPPAKPVAQSPSASAGKDTPSTTQELLDWVAKVKGLNTRKEARDFLIKECGIQAKEVDFAPASVYRMVQHQIS